MKFAKLFILIAVSTLFGTALHAGVGLEDDSLIEIKPKTCDFQWWKGSKNYNADATTDKNSENPTSTTKK